MKRLIVLAATATLLGSLSGCSILNGPGAQSCDPTPPSPLLSRLRLPQISLPWNRANDLAAPNGCNTCNEGFSEVGGYGGGQIIDQGGYTDGAVISSQSLYHPDAVYSGPVVIDSGSSYAGELIPTPVSPELGSVR